MEVWIEFTFVMRNACSGLVSTAVSDLTEFLARHLHISIQKLYLMNHHFFPAIVKLRKAIINCIMSVSMPAWNNSVPTGRVFVKFDMRGFF